MSAAYLFFSSWLRAGITMICHNHRFKSAPMLTTCRRISVVCHNHRFIRSPNSKVGSFEIAKIKIAKIISHTFTFKSRKFSTAKISRYTVFILHLNWIGTQLVRTNPIEAHNSSNIIVARLNSILISTRCSSISARNKSITVHIYSINGGLFQLVCTF